MPPGLTPMAPKIRDPLICLCLPALRTTTTSQRLDESVKARQCPRSNSNNYRGAPDLMPKTSLCQVEGRLGNFEKSTLVEITTAAARRCPSIKATHRNSSTSRMLRQFFPGGCIRRLNHRAVRLLARWPELYQR